MVNERGNVFARGKLEKGERRKAKVETTEYPVKTGDKQTEKLIHTHKKNGQKKERIREDTRSTNSAEEQEKELHRMAGPFRFAWHPLIRPYQISRNKIKYEEEI